jgi:hypothetical protein
MISVLRGKKLKAVRPSNPFPRNPQRFHPMLQQSIPRHWHFTTPEHEGLSIRLSRFTGEFDLSRRTQVGEMCWETTILSSHQTLEQAVTAADRQVLVASR